MAPVSSSVTATFLFGTGWIVKPHAHEARLEFVAVASGEILAEIGTLRRHFSAGDVFVLTPRTVLSIYAEKEAAVRSFVFDQRVVGDAMDNLDFGLLSMLRIQAQSRLIFFGAEHPLREQLFSLIADAVDEYGAKDVAYALALRADASRAVTALLRDYQSSRGDDMSQVYHNVMRLFPAIDYIYVHCSEKIYIEKLADLIGITSDHFTKIFREALDITPVDYINSVRMNRALRLLAESDASIADVAAEAGFANANYFHKLFKAAMDTSPLNYRKR